MSGSAERLGAAARRELVRSCLEARRLRSRPVISGYSVGAALLGGDGRLYCAGNIECWGQTPSICAERTALFKALSELCTDFAALAVCGGPATGKTVFLETVLWQIGTEFSVKEALFLAVDLRREGIGSFAQSSRIPAM